MLLLCALFTSALVLSINCYNWESNNYGNSNHPLPFPICYANDVDCLRRGLRTFLFLMDSQYMGMKQIDPAILNSIGVSFPEQRIDIRLRNVNVTGARWTKLVSRSFSSGAKNNVIFSSDLHVTADLLMNMADRITPMIAKITLDIQGVESNVTYNWFNQRHIDKEDYIIIGQERIAVRNRLTPTYFLQPQNEDTYEIDKILQVKSSVLDYLANEITASIMYTMVENFRIFANKIPMRFYYKYTK